MLLKAPMTDDHTLVALIGHSVLAETDAQKRAARLLLDTLRNGNGLDCLHAQVEAIEPVQAARVAEELAVYIERYRLDVDEV